MYLFSLSLKDWSSLHPIKPISSLVLSLLICSESTTSVLLRFSDRLASLPSSSVISEGFSGSANVTLMEGVVTSSPVGFKKPVGFVGVPDELSLFAS